MPSRATSLLILCILLAPSTLAQNQDPYATGTCEPAQATATLETGNVRAGLFNDGQLFWKSGDNVYNVPKSGPVTAIFASSLWIAGFVDGDLRVAGSSYGPYEFWPGPLPIDGSPPSDCTSWDRFWSLDRDEDLNASSGGLSLTSANEEWPIDLGAPYVDVDGVDGYQPERGDYPMMNGDTQHWWIMNDRGNEHTRFKTLPLGVEVIGRAFGFNTDNDLGNVTFYRYHIANKGTETIRDMHVGLYQDVDMGGAKNDSAGSDSTLALLYVYQLYNEDGDSASNGYGINPPAIGYTILEASHSAGILPTDLALPASAHATSAHNSFNAGGGQGDASSAMDMYYYLSGRWRNGEPIREGGSGYGSTGKALSFWMPGDPVEGTYWSERNTDGTGTMHPPSDRKLALAYGAFDLAPGEWAQFTFANVWAQGADHLDSVTQVKRVTRELHASKASILAPRTPIQPEFVDGNPPEEPQYPFWVDEPYPNPVPSGDEFILRLSARWDTPITITVSDLLGRLQMQSTRPTQPGETSIPIPTEAWAPGIYLVKVQQRHESVVQRVIVQ